MWPGSVGTIMKSQIVLNAQKNPYLNQATRKILAIIFHPKSKIPNPKKSFDYPCHLKSGLILHQPSIKGVKLNISALSNFG